MGSFPTAGRLVVPDHAQCLEICDVWVFLQWFPKEEFCRCSFLGFPWFPIETIGFSRQEPHGGQSSTQGQLIKAHSAQKTRQVTCRLWSDVFNSLNSETPVTLLSITANVPGRSFATWKARIRHLQQTCTARTSCSRVAICCLCTVQQHISRNALA